MTQLLKPLRRRTRPIQLPGPRRGPDAEPIELSRDRDAPDPDLHLLTANFDRSLAERLGPGCFRVLAAQPAL